MVARRYKQLQLPFPIMDTLKPEYFEEREVKRRLDSLYSEREQAVCILSGGDVWLAWFFRFNMNVLLKKKWGWVLVGYGATWTAHGPMLTLHASDSEGKQVVAFLSARTWEKVMRDLIFLVRTNQLRWQKDKYFYKKLDELHGRR